MSVVAHLTRSYVPLCKNVIDHCQADTGAPLAAPLNTAPPSWDGGRALPPQHRSLADRMRGPFGGRAGHAGTSGTPGPLNV